MTSCRTLTDSFHIRITCPQRESYPGSQRLEALAPTIAPSKPRIRSWFDYVLKRIRVFQDINALSGTINAQKNLATANNLIRSGLQNCASFSDTFEWGGMKSLNISLCLYFEDLYVKSPLQLNTNVLETVYKRFWSGDGCTG